MEFDINNHYWIVGGNEARVWSSFLRGYVPSNFDAYTAWVADGGLPSRIISEGDLYAYINRSVLEQIANIERAQARPIREIALGFIPVEGEPTPQDRLQSLEDQISMLRNQLL